MRLGADPVKLHEGTRAREIFGEAVIYKRHRHRYEVNNQLRRRLEDEGLVCGGTSPDERLVEMIELPDHPFFVASQFHPEFNSRPNRPEPLFREFIGAAVGTRAAPADDGELPDPEAAERSDDVSVAVRPTPAALPLRRDLQSRRSALRLEVTSLPGVERLHETFVRLCEIRSPTGEEREVADSITAMLRALGLDVVEDGAAVEAQAGAGNLLAGSRASDRWVLFCAHIDTVPHEGHVEVVNDEGVFRSAGDTILGADNKAAVAVLMELAARYRDATAPGGDRAPSDRR